MSTIKAVFKPPTADTSILFRDVTHRVENIIRLVQNTDPHGKEWLLTGETKDASLLYPAFDNNGELTTAAEAVLETKFKNQNARYLSAWNGELIKKNGASLSLMFNNDGWPSWEFDLSYPGEDFNRLGGLKGMQLLVSLIASDLRPDYINVARHQYFEKQVFQDRPGVGWMLYLPTILSSQQVPEARALVPVKGKTSDGRDSQIGTIIVSVTDDFFSDENPEHVSIANAIEIRLVDQDLLPRLADL